jgi:ElaB/YqjD/DUF883 family membrane-anchored ribosome-binding protein
MENGGRSGGEDPTRRTGERLAERASEMREKAQERMTDMRDRATEQMEGMRGYAADAGAWISSFARERPALAIAVAAGLGFLLGRMASRT